MQPWKVASISRLSIVYSCRLNINKVMMSSIVVGKEIRKKEWFHPGSIRGPSPRQDDVITNYTMKPF